MRKVNIIDVGDIVSSVKICKTDNHNDEGYEALECTLTFLNGLSIEYLIEDRNFELWKDEYHRGIYSYINGIITQIEDWDN